MTEESRVVALCATSGVCQYNVRIISDQKVVCSRAEALSILLDISRKEGVGSRGESRFAPTGVGNPPLAPPPPRRGIIDNFCAIIDFIFYYWRCLLDISNNTQTPILTIFSGAIATH
ncbi:MAG: hypothetical protein F6K54_30695 [Okeania sp. SIO3B5]|uniref:hypothetical protein n=1 Tax=Okeania sp. SIO3B5 TaxID=2607811 RepID=UPI0013FF7946|nr:hypothetical protein [Okeania sp. SIO3B5]NEO57055.1 hypothetical protein [Okeania sp. SIO3B5]